MTAIPDIKQFKNLCKKGNLIPVYKETLADLDTPVSAFRKLGESPSFLLESVEGGEMWARYSFLGIRPSKIIKGFKKRIEIAGADGTETREVDDPISFLKEIMSVYKAVEAEGLPRFFGGLVGYLGYDMVRFIEDLPEKDWEQRLDMPDMYLMLADTMLIFDNLKQKIKVVSNVHMDGSREPEEAYAEAVAKVDDIIEKLKAPLSAEPERPGSAGAGEFVSSFGPKEEFEAAVLKAKEYVRAGDIIQVVLSQRFERSSTAEPLSIYRALRVINPSPYMYYLDTGDAHIVGSSPEILVRAEGGKVTLRPIAGTRRRGDTDAEDLELEADLKADPKEVAEHIMLVDLGRNDVGRVAEMGSVRVTELMNVERYSHVMHMVSNVLGDLREGLDSFDVLRASFPAGTVTGAPKVRAMQIIDELEPTRRGPYAGAVGYFSYSGNMDTCITIRTLVIKDGMVYVQAGAGIVADSVPENEYLETVSKAKGMMKAVDMAGEIAD
jgi:anthranilate synthase component 1